MKAILLLMIGVLTIGATSCKKSSSGSSGPHVVTGNYLVVGASGGFIGGAMTAYYCITTTDFRKDTTVRMPPGSVSGFNFSVLLPSTAFDSVKDLLTSIPVEMLVGSKSYGVMWPDFGHTDLRAYIDGKTYQWFFEADLSSESIAIREFAAKVSGVYKY